MTGELERDFVTVLETRGPLATKKIIRVRGQSAPRIESYGRAALFSFREIGVSNIDELAASLGALEHQPRCFIVRGRPKPGVDYRMARRLVRDRRNGDGTITPATLESTPRHWIALDCDRIPCPDRLDPLFEPDWIVEHVVSSLPAEFHDATCAWQFTASHGIKPGISLRLFFWADRPVADWELKIWFAGSPVDHAIFEPAQPIYVAWPVFENMPDPAPFRSGIWRGDRDVVTPPLIERLSTRASAAPVQPFSGDPGGGYEFHCGRIGDHEGGDVFYRPVKAAAASWIARLGSSVDTGWLRADLEHAIREASRDPREHDDLYVEFRINDLDTLIPAITELQKAKEADRHQFAECEPTYPAPVGTVEDARELLAQVFDGHVTSIANYAEATAAYAATLKEWEARQAA